MFRIVCGDALRSLQQMQAESVQCCVTSPPYFGLRDYGVEGQIGLEATPDAYVERLVEVFREVRRVLKDDGTLWLNLGDSYATGGGRVGDAPGGGKQGENWRLRGIMTPPNRMPLPGLKPKDLIGIPWRVAFALQADGWYLRSDIIWHKPNPMPESVTDRPTKAHEYVFLMSKSERYYYDCEAVREVSRFPGDDRHNRRDLRKEIDPMCIDGGSRRKTAAPNRETRNRRTVWTLTTCPTPEAHFATFPIDLCETCILAGARPGGTVLDPFNGAGTTGLAALKHGRDYVGIEINPKYVEISHTRAQKHYPLLASVYAG